MTDSLLDRLAPLIDESAGVLRGVDRLPVGGAVLPAFSAAVGRIDALHPGPHGGTGEPGDLAGYGTATDEATARLRAVCEGFERYSLMLYPADGVVEATARQLGDQALDLGRLPRCSPAERAAAPADLRLLEPDPDRPDRWVAGWSLTRSAPLYLPLTIAWMGIPLPIAEHHLFPMSTGFAAGSDPPSAVAAALGEVVERDSCALWWLRQLPLPRIVLDSPDPALARLLENAARAGYRTTLLDLTTDAGLPVVGAIQTSERRWPHALVTAAGRTTGLAAAIRAVEEAETLRLGLASRAGIDHEAGRAAILAGEPAEPLAFAGLYAGPDGPARFAFATERSPVRSSLPAGLPGPRPLAAMVDRLAAIGAEVIAVDVTAAEVRDHGLVVVRVIVPELTTFTFSHAIRYLGHPRLREASRRLGLPDTPVTNAPIPFG